jgi:F-type H+-transporting ATPase subunit delta
MKHISPKKYAISLFETLQSTPTSEHAHLIASFVRLLAKHKMIGRVDKIINQLKLHMDKEAHIKTVQVSSAEPLDEKNKKNIIDQLEKDLGCKIEIVESVKPELIGGVMVAYDDVRIDGSIKKQLEVLSQQLHS